MSPDGSPRILIIEDDRDMRRVLSQIVERLGCRPVVVSRAVRAVRVLEQELVSAILLDLRMPDLNGDELLRYLDAKRVKIPPTLVVSGHVAHEHLKELVKLGVRGVIAKPFRVQRLVAELQRVLEGATDWAGPPADASAPGNLARPRAEEVAPAE